ncbi:hypothetical protein V1509DRAFT_677166 [Lipomyces kononenkoae]
MFWLSWVLLLCVCWGVFLYLFVVAAPELSSVENQEMFTLPFLNFVGYRSTNPLVATDTTRAFVVNSSSYSLRLIGNPASTDNEYEQGKLLFVTSLSIFRELIAVLRSALTAERPTSPVKRLDRRCNWSNSMGVDVMNSPRQPNKRKSRTRRIKKLNIMPGNSGR